MQYRPADAIDVSGCGGGKMSGCLTQLPLDALLAAVNSLLSR